MADKEKFEEEALAEFIELTGIPKEMVNQYGKVRSFVYNNASGEGEKYEFKTPGLAILLGAQGYPAFYFPKKPNDISEPVLSHSETTGFIYVYFGGEKYEITKDAIEAVEAIKALEQKSSNEIIYCKDCKYSTCWRSGEIAEKYGKGMECSKKVILCPNDYDYCSKAVKIKKCPNCGRRYDTFPNFCSECGTPLRRK